jgi:hypothetical protein
VTADEFRKLALAFPETSEGVHMGHPDFRVGGRIFASLGYPDAGWGMVNLTPDQQQVLVRADPRVFAPGPGAWGRNGCTSVRLRSARKTVVRGALLQAWRKRAPKRLAARFDTRG